MAKPEKMILMGYGVLVVALLAFAGMMMVGKPDAYDATSVSKVPWQPYSESKVKEALTAGKPVMIDFFAIWCGPCRQMEHNVFSRQDVGDAATNFMAFRVDLSDDSNEPNRKVAQQYSITGLPTLVFLGTNGQEKIHFRLLGVEEPGKLIQRLKAAQ